MSMLKERAMSTPGLRISSGVAKNKALKSPKIPGIKLAQEIVRQALFAILDEKIKNALCLDIYAGSGSIGIEALSRGAGWCDFIDINKEATNTIKENLKLTGLELKAQVYTTDSLKYLSNTEKNYDIIFLDPYYDQASHKHIFKVLPQALKKDGVIIFLHGKGLDVSNQLENTELKLLDERKYGATYLTLIKLVN